MIAAKDNALIIVTADTEKRTSTGTALAQRAIMTLQGTHTRRQTVEDYMKWGNWIQDTGHATRAHYRCEVEFIYAFALMMQVVILSKPLMDHGLTIGQGAIQNRHVFQRTKAMQKAFPLEHLHHRIQDTTEARALWETLMPQGAVELEQEIERQEAIKREKKRHGRAVILLNPRASDEAMDYITRAGWDGNAATKIRQYQPQMLEETQPDKTDTAGEEKGGAITTAEQEKKTEQTRRKEPRLN